MNQLDCAVFHLTRICQPWPKTILKVRGGASHRKRERETCPCPWRLRVIWVKSPKLGDECRCQGRAGLRASWSSKPPVFLGDYLGEQWARSITVFVVATTLDQHKVKSLSIVMLRTLIHETMDRTENTHKKTRHLHKIHKQNPSTFRP